MNRLNGALQQLLVKKSLFSTKPNSTDQRDASLNRNGIAGARCRFGRVLESNLPEKREQTSLEAGSAPEGRTARSGSPKSWFGAGVPPGFYRGSEKCRWQIGGKSVANR